MKNTIMVSKDGKTEILVDTPTEVTQLKAQGFTEKVETDHVDWSKKRKADLENEIAQRNADRAEDERIVVAGEGHVPDLVAALQADDAAAEAAK